MESKYARLMGAGLLVASNILLPACAKDSTQPTLSPAERTATARANGVRPNELPTVALLEITSRIDSLIDAKSEDQVWQNTLKIAPLTYQAYCMVFPGCVQPAPSVSVVSLSEYQDATQRHVPSGYRPTEDEVNTIIASTFEDRTTVINKDQRRLRLSLQGALFSNVVSQMPSVLLSEQHHADVARTREIYLELVGSDGKVHTLNRFWGFGIESDQTDGKLTLIQEASAILASFRVQEKMGVNKDTMSISFVGVANYLQDRMKSAGLTIEDLVLLHRESNLDALLERIYPQTQDVNQRRLLAIGEFDRVYQATK